MEIIDNMDKDHRIWEMSDADFLNFLYQEREREYSKSSSWGINFWAVGAAIIGLLGYAYHAISKDYCSFDWRMFLYYSTVMGDLMILGTILLLPLIKRDRWVDKYRVTTIRYNAPVVAIYGKTVIAYNSFYWLLKLKDFDVVFWLWGSLLVLEIIICVYLLVNQNKLIRISQRGYIFGNYVLEWIYRVAEGGICVSILLMSLYIWGNQYYMEVREFEMACVFAIIIGLSWFAFYRMLDKRYRFMDRWIDQYIYGNLTKENAYLSLLLYSQDYDIVDILYTELKKVQPIMKELKERQNNLKQYEQLIETGNLSFDDSRTYKHVVDDNMEKAKTALDTAKHLNDVMREIIRLDTYPSSMDTFKLLDQQIEELKNELLEFVDRSLVISKQLFEFTRPFLCVQYGGFCKVENCVERHKKPSVFKRIKIRCICAFKNRFLFVNKK